MVEFSVEFNTNKEVIEKYFQEMSNTEFLKTNSILPSYQLYDFMTDCGITVSSIFERKQHYTEAKNLILTEIKFDKSLSLNARNEAFTKLDQTTDFMPDIIQKAKGISLNNYLNTLFQLGLSPADFLNEDALNHYINVKTKKNKNAITNT